jgi:hypothetical protein
MPISATYNPSAPSATTTQGVAVGNREDLSNMLTVLEPKDSPIFSMISKEKATSTFHEWLVDNLDSPVADGVNEAEDVSAFADKFDNMARLGNYVQTFRRSYRVSNLQNAVTSAAPVNIVKAEAKAMLELKRDVEFAIASANDRQAATGAVPYKLRGLGDWIDTAGPSDVPAEFRTPTASIVTSTLTESGLNNILGSIYSETGEMGNLTAVVNVALRKVIAGFLRAEGSTTATPYTVNQDADARKITLSVSLVDTDFGIIKIVNGNPACMPTSSTNYGYVLDPKYLAFASLIPMGSTRLENQGGGERGFCDMTGTLVCRSPLAHGKIAY